MRKRPFFMIKIIYFLGEQISAAVFFFLSPSRRRRRVFSPKLFGLDFCVCRQMIKDRAICFTSTTARRKQ